MPAALRKMPRDYSSLVMIETPSYVIGAHANYRRDDFVFPRVQSREMREAAWADRVAPLRSWSEIIGAGLLFTVASLAILLSTTFV